jgi:L-seryl-tRNA(Ser) seleniumtransferase
METMTTDPRRGLPAVDTLLAHPAVASSTAAFGRGPVTAAVRRTLDASRRAAAEGAPIPGLDELAGQVTAALAAAAGRRMRAVVNATGVVLHTNLGRAPLSEAAQAAVAAAAGYATVEYDLAQGARGRRGVAVAALLREVTGAEAGLAVNNAAGALLLCLHALARGREVIVSRGELIEIGGEFRLPSVIEAAGVALVEVGTTNRTHLADYARAIGERTAAVLVVHPSNYRVEGFTRQAGVAELAALGVILVHDIGSGLLAPHPLLPGEPDAATSLAQGANLVTASGDKLLGGPQAGILLGDEPLVRTLLRHPLARALRVDKLTLAALEATISGPLPPVARSLTVTAAALADRAERLAATLTAHDIPARVVDAEAAVGGGGAPGVTLPSVAIALPEELGSALRHGPAVRRGESPAVAGRVAGGALLLDLRSVDPADDARLVTAVLLAAGA